MYPIVVDRRHAILFARAEGYMGAEQVLRLSRRLDEAAGSLGAGHLSHGRLIDLSRATVVARDAIELLQQEILSPRRRLRAAMRVAYFGASPLLAHQVRHLCRIRPGLAYFDDRRAAYEFLRRATSSSKMAVESEHAGA